MTALLYLIQIYVVVDRFKGSGVSPRGVLPLDCLQKRGSGFYRFIGFRGGWCGAKNNEAPQSFDSASRRRHLERSREILLAERSACQLRYFNHRLLLIPSHQSLLYPPADPSGKPVPYFFDAFLQSSTSCLPKSPCSCSNFSMTEAVASCHSFTSSAGTV